MWGPQPLPALPSPLQRGALHVALCGVSPQGEGLTALASDHME